MTTQLTNERLERLISVLAHIRTSYSTNRTPEYSTPPLLILYSCRPTQQCGGLAERLLDITTGFYQAMLNTKTDSAFGYDMTFPVRLEWYLEPTPEHIVMRTHQAQFYLDRAKVGQVKWVPIVRADIEQERTDERILSTTSWQSRDWNRTTSERAGRYGLRHLKQQSDWFFVASRLLFRQPSDWLAQQLEPYSHLMGTIRLSESLNGQDPVNLVLPQLNPTRFCVGVRVTREKDVEGLARHVLQICDKCHVFVSANSAGLLYRMRQELNPVPVHAVAEKYPFNDLDVFPQDQSNIKMHYARIFMDWLILSRMNHLVGYQDDLFIKTVAWAAQVQTDVLKYNGEMGSLSDW